LVFDTGDLHTISLEDFLSSATIHLYLGLNKGFKAAGKLRVLQREHLAFQNVKFLFFYFLCLPRSGSNPKRCFSVHASFLSTSETCVALDLDQEPVLIVIQLSLQFLYTDFE